jgi:hypothetical protein
MRGAISPMTHGPRGVPYHSGVVPFYLYHKREVPYYLGGVSRFHIFQNTDILKICFNSTKFCQKTDLYAAKKRNISKKQNISGNKIVLFRH